MLTWHSLILLPLSAHALSVRTLQTSRPAYSLATSTKLAECHLHIICKVFFPVPIREGAEAPSTCGAVRGAGRRAGGAMPSPGVQWLGC